jgi:hypothetical protein
MLIEAVRRAVVKIRSQTFHTEAHLDLAGERMDHHRQNLRDNPYDEIGQEELATIEADTRIFSDTIRNYYR